MTTFTFPYSEKTHVLFGQVGRPIIELELYAERFGRWLRLKHILADTGADLSVVPLPVGQILVPDVEQGAPIHLGGSLETGAPFNAYVHRVSARLGSAQFDMPLAIASLATMPIIFGRREALDRFEACFVNAKN